MYTSIVDPVINLLSFQSRMILSAQHPSMSQQLSSRVLHVAMQRGVTVSEVQNMRLNRNSGGVGHPRLMCVFAPAPPIAASKSAHRDGAGSAQQHAGAPAWRQRALQKRAMRCTVLATS
jgi:hypothetical protein